MHGFGFRWSVLAAALAAAGPAVAQPGADRYHLELPGQDLGQALNKVALATGTNLIVPADLVAGKSSPPLAGDYSADEAFARLLQGSGLSARRVDGALVVGADPSPAYLPAQDGEVVVTGTHLRGVQPTSPVIALSRRQIDQAAPPSVEELMRKLPQNVSAGVGQENAGVTGAGADITDHGAGINLRGLGQRATLVLVDGRRVAPSGSGTHVDVSLIPVSAIERVEILTDGASAIYGSDAVGGVVNLILRDRLEGIETMLQAGTTTSGGGGQWLAGLSAGHDWSGGRALLAYEFRGEQPIQAGQRGFTLDLPSDWSLLPRERRHSLYASARQELAPGVSLDLSGNFARRDTRRSYFIAGPAVPVDAHATARAFGGTAALDVSLGGSWRAEASASYHRDRTRQRQLQPAGAGLVNIFDSLNAIAEMSLNADGNLGDLPGGAVNVALGASVRREHFESLFETQVNLPDPQSASRTVSALYGEIALPLVGPDNRRPGLERLLLTAAGRFETYRGIGSSIDPKLGLLFSPAKGLRLRSSYGTSFRAPLLSERLGFYNVFLFPAALLYLDPASAPDGVGAALVGSNPAVGPETSTSFAAGVEFEPPGIRGLRLEATYYAVRFSNRIALPTEQIVVIGDPALAPIVTLNPDVGLVGSQFAGASQVLDFSGPGFTNGGATAADVVAIVDARIANSAQSRTDGLDLLAGYEFEAGGNHFRAELNLNRVLSFKERLTKASPPIDVLDTPFHALSWRGRAGFSWSRGPWSAIAFLNHSAPYTDRRRVEPVPVRSWTTADLTLAFDGTGTQGALRDVRLAFSVQNLFDTDPPRLLPEPGFTRGTGYDPVNASGRGRMVSLQLRRIW